MSWNFAIAGLAIAVGLLMIAAPPTEAAVVTVGISHPPQNLNADTCMDVFGNDLGVFDGIINSVPVIAFGCHAGPNQQFQFQGSTIYAMGAQRCLGWITALPSHREPLFLIESMPCDNGLNQQFLYEQGQIVIASPVPGGGLRCIEAEDMQLGTRLTARPCGAPLVGSGPPVASQQWQIK